jgi:hypothetical protein
MRRQSLAGPGWALLIRDPALADLRLQRRNTSLYFLEDEGLLRVRVF